MKASAAIALLCCAAPLAGEQIIITEIMYNPDSVEGRTTGDNPLPCMTEWVELYNTADADADLAGWTLGDEDGRTGPIPDGITLKPGEALVLIPAECDPAAFIEAWGDGFQIVPLTGWSKGGMSQLANTPDQDNEILTLHNPAGQVIDTVNYDDEGDWPADEPDGPSIYLQPDALSSDANDLGSHWARSADGLDGARFCTRNSVFTGKDLGSPGTVNSPAPGSASTSGSAAPMLPSLPATKIPRGVMIPGGSKPSRLTSVAADRRPGAGGPGNRLPRSFRPRTVPGAG